MRARLARWRLLLLAGLLLGILGVLTGADAGGSKKKPAPSAEAQEKSTKVIRAIFKARYDKAKDPGNVGFGRDRFYAPGFADLLQALEDTLLTQTILDQAVSPAEAREQVKALIKAMDFLLGKSGDEEAILWAFNQPRKVQARILDKAAAPWENAEQGA